MYHRIATTLVAAAVGGVTLMAASSPAMAHPTPVAEASPGAKPAPVRHVAPAPVRIASLDVSPDPVVVKGNGRVTVTATVTTVNAKAVSVDFRPKGRSSGGYRWSSPEWSHGEYGTRYPGGKGNWDKWDKWHGSVSLSRKDPDGPWVVTVTALGHDGTRVQQHASFTVRHVPRVKATGPRPTRIVGFDAGPEPVRKNRKLTLSGRLQAVHPARCRDGWYASGGAVVFRAGHCGADRPYRRWLGWKDIHVFFQKKGSRHWTYVDTISTNPDGSFVTKVRARASGTWKVVYRGDRGLLGSQAVDYVKVVR